MARLVLVKDLSTINPSITDIILSTIVGNNDIKRHDSNTIYNAGDRAYQIINGEIVVKESASDGTTGEDFVTNWTVVDSVIGGGSGAQNQNTFQSISFFEKKLSNDISVLTNVLGTMADLSAEGLRGTFMFPLFTDGEITLNGGIHEFGRVII